MIYLLVLLLSLVSYGFTEEKKETLLLFTFDEANSRVLKIQIPSNFKQMVVENQFCYFTQFFPQNESIESWSEVICITIAKTKETFKDFVYRLFGKIQIDNISILNEQSNCKLIGNNESYFYIERLANKSWKDTMFIPMKGLNESMHVHFFQNQNEVFIVQYSVRHSKEILKTDKNRLLKKMEAFIFENCKTTELENIPDWQNKIVHAVNEKDGIFELVPINLVNTNKKESSH